MKTTGSCSFLLRLRWGEGVEGGGIFAGDDLGFGVDAGLERVEAGYGLPLQASGAGGFLRITMIRLDVPASSGEVS